MTKELLNEIIEAKKALEIAEKKCNLLADLRDKLSDPDYIANLGDLAKAFAAANNPDTAEHTKAIFQAIKEAALDQVNKELEIAEEEEAAAEEAFEKF